MKQCLNCHTEFEYKRESAKFCSDKCRATYNRAHPKQLVTPIQMQVLYNEILELASKMKGVRPEVLLVNPISPQTAVAIHNAENKDQHTEVITYDYNGLKGLISAATSSTELHAAWKIIENANLAGWQLRQLSQLKEHQRTKIDF